MDKFKRACAAYGKPASYAADMERGRELKGSSCRSHEPVRLFRCNDRGDRERVRRGICSRVKDEEETAVTRTEDITASNNDTGEASAEIKLGGETAVGIRYTREDGTRCRRIPPFLTSSCCRAENEDYKLEVEEGKLTVTLKKGVKDITLTVGGTEHVITRGTGGGEESTDNAASGTSSNNSANVSRARTTADEAYDPITVSAAEPSATIDTSSRASAPVEEIPISPPATAPTSEAPSDEVTTRATDAPQALPELITQTDLSVFRQIERPAPPPIDPIFGYPIGRKVEFIKEDTRVLAYLFNRPSKSSEEPNFALQVTKDSTPNPIRDAAISAYEQNLMGLDSIIFNPLKPLNTPVEVNGTTYTKAQVRPDGSVLLGKENSSDGFAVLRPNMVRSSNSVNWDLVRINSAGEILNENGILERADNGVKDSASLIATAQVLVKVLKDRNLMPGTDPSLVITNYLKNTSNPLPSIAKLVTAAGAENLGRLVREGKEADTQDNTAVIDKFLEALPVEALNKLKENLNTLASEHSRWISSYDRPAIDAALGAVFNLEKLNPGSISLAQLYWASISDTPWDTMINELLPAAKNRAKLAYIALGSAPSQSKVVSVPAQLEVDLTSRGSQGLQDPAGIKVEASGANPGYWSVIRSWEGKPTVLQVVDNAAAETNDTANTEPATVLAAYRANTSEYTLRFNEFRQLNPQFTPTGPTTSPTFTKAQIRSDGSVLLADADEQNFRIIKPKRKKDQTGQPTDFIEWVSEEVTFSPEKGVQKKPTSA